MAWSRLQSASNTAVGSATVTATFGSNATSGTKIIAAFAWGSSAITITSVQDAAANNWTQLALKAGTNIQVALYGLDTPAGDVGLKPAIKVTLSAVSDVSLLVQEVSGLLAGNTTAMLDGTAASLTGNNGASTGSPSYSSTASNEYLTAVYGDNGGPETYTKPAALTDDANSVNSSSTSDISISFGNSTNGAEAGSYALTGTAADWCVLLCAFKLAAGGAAPSQVLPLRAPPQAPAPPPPPPSRVIPFLGALTGTAILSGSGTLAAAPFFSGAAALSGSGTLTATFTTAGTAPYVVQAPAQPPQPPRPPAAQVIGTPLAVAFTSSATLTGSGTLTAAPFFSGAAVLSGSGTLTAGPGVGGLPLLIVPVIQPPQPAQPPRGQVIGLTPSALISGATLTGSGTLAGAPYFDATGTVLSGTGTLTGVYTTAGAPPYVLIAVIQPPQPPQPPPGRLLGVPPPPPPPVLQSATTTATVTEGTKTTATVSDQASTTATVSDQASITASVT